MSGGALWLAGVLIALGGAIFLLVTASQGSGRKRLRRRLAQVTGKEEASPSNVREVTVRRDVADSSIRALDKLIKRLIPRPAKLRERLAATGKRISLAEYLLASLLTGAVFFAGLTVMVHPSLAVALLFSLTIMIALPFKVISSMAGRRQRRFLALFPESIELIVRGLKSGIPISESIKVVGRELPDPVGLEFRGITNAMLLGQSFDEALATASKRINLPEFRFFEISLGIQQETGGNLAETLDNLANILRKRKQMKQKVKALSSEARASAYILGSLPFLMFLTLYVLSPDYISVLLFDPRGHIIVAAAQLFLAIGVGIMIRMGKFQI
jgi:tight adherence protein B